MKRTMTIKNVEGIDHHTKVVGLSKEAGYVIYALYVTLCFKIIALVRER